jgi:hypothetical protein
MPRKQHDDLQWYASAINLRLNCLSQPILLNCIFLLSLHFVAILFVVEKSAIGICPAKDTLMVTVIPELPLATIAIGRSEKRES